ncbi:MAG TPA: FAD-binding oxidoreductase [Acidimicrobiia bacterium]|nr:FAD-binding oxidoreductase [Acidimicrobiia bacterium]
MSDARRKGQTDWRKEINQHETFSHDSIDSLAYDWDRIGDPHGGPRLPLKFYVPQTTDDVVRCVKECALLGQVLTVRSKGHSSNDLVTPIGGAVLLTDKLHGVIEVDEQALTATVWSGTPSADVDDHLATLGLGLPVIGDHAHITVGGFASVGGITASSFKYGLFVDIVQRLEYVDWDGEVHVVDRSDGVDDFNRLLMGLGRHGVITKITLTIIATDKYKTYWRNDDTRYRELAGFIASSRDLCAEPPEDAQFLRGLWVDFPMASGKSVKMGTFSVYRDADPSLARRSLESVAYGGLHRLGWLAGRLPEKVDKAVKLAGMAGVVMSPKYATVKNAEFFTEKILDATVGDPQRFLVVISPIGIYEEQFRLLWEMMVDYRTRFRCFTFLTLYVKSIKSPYLAQGDPDNERWVEFLFYVGIDPEVMTDSLLARIADDLDQNCIDTGSYRYMHTRTGRDPVRLAKIDPNAPYNAGVSVHPSDRAPGLADA